MSKITFLTAFHVFCLTLTSFSRVASDSVHINIGVLDTAKAQKVSLVLEISNLSGQVKKALKNGRVDYINGKTNPIGNYIVEVEKLQNGKFVPFPPTADIDPVLDKGDYWEIKPNGFLMETIILNGSSWKSTGFPKGQYRVRVAFNWDEWSGSLKNMSKWIVFTIE